MYNDNQTECRHIHPSIHPFLSEIPFILAFPVEQGGYDVNGVTPYIGTGTLYLCIFGTHVIMTEICLTGLKFKCMEGSFKVIKRGHLGNIYGCIIFGQTNGKKSDENP